MNEPANLNQGEIETLKIILWVAGSAISLLLIIIGFFVSRLVSDIKSNSEKIGKNRGTIELVSQKQEQDIVRIERTTQLELKALTEQVGTLASSVQALVEIQIKKS